MAGRKAVPFKDKDGTTYEIMVLGGLEGYEMYAKIAAATEGKGPAASIAAILQIPGLVETLARNTFVLGNGKKVQLWSIFDGHFAANYEALNAWLGACLGANFPKRKEESDQTANGESDSSNAAETKSTE